MAIERTFEAAFLKAVRSLEITSRDILWDPGLTSINESEAALGPHDERLWFLLSALRRKHNPTSLSEITYVDPWFINSLNRITSMETRLLNEVMTHDLIRVAKRMGFSDAQIATLTDRTEYQILHFRL